MTLEDSWHSSSSIMTSQNSNYHVIVNVMANTTGATGEAEYIYRLEEWR